MTFEAPVNGTPFNNPSAQPELVQMWRSAINKARQEIPPPPLLPACIEANFDAGGVVLTVPMACFVEVTFPCRILSCHMFAGTASVTSGIVPTSVTASVELRLARQGVWSAGSSALYGTGVRPTMTATSETNVSITGWVTDLQPGDVLTYVLATFTGAATVLGITLPIRRLDVVGVGANSVLDSALNTVIDSSGNVLVNR
jgi:hypothetical protein